MPHPEHLAFLVAHGAATFGHTDQGLLAHLQGVEALLAAWGARPEVCAAGLFHSVYGTESYRAQVIPPSLRPEVRACIGDAAEQLAWLFGVMERESLYTLVRADGAGSGLTDRLTGASLPLDTRTVADLCDLTVANWLEQRPRAPERHQYLRRAELERMLPRLLPAARAALAAAYGFTSDSGALTGTETRSQPRSDALPEK